MLSKLTTNRSVLSKTKLNLILDIALFVAFLIVYQAKATGVTAHEWLGIGIGAAFIVHILLHWQWVASITQRFFRKIKTEPRINYILNAGLFVCFTTSIFSGLMISHAVLPFLGLEAAGSAFWKSLHFTSSDVSVWLVALHVALHWRWIVNAVKRYAIVPVGQMLGRTPRQTRQTKPYSA